MDIHKFVESLTEEDLIAVLRKKINLHEVEVDFSNLLAAVKKAAFVNDTRVHEKAIEEAAAVIEEQKKIIDTLAGELAALKNGGDK